MADTTDTPRLTQLVSCAGCAAKLDPSMLAKVLAGVDWPQSDQVLVGFDQCDDAGVFRCKDGTRLIATTDFFTPIVDDPYTYGAAAAANALSDIYAMGGDPLFALSIVLFPEKLDGDILRQILDGAAAICREAGCPVIGGHSVRCDQITFGLAITGRLPDDREPIANAGARPGDHLILTKALGTGLLATALKKDALPDDASAALHAQLLRLNRDAGRLCHQHTVRCATDVTGFGLVGHGAELASASEVTLRIDTAALPLLPGIEAAIAAGCVTRGDQGNRAYAGERLIIEDGVARHRELACTDPQSSGGLLIACPADHSAALLTDLHAAGDVQSAIIGAVEAGPPRVVLAG